jgi:hypothetical protein
MSTDDRRAPGATRIPFDALVEVGASLGPSFEAQAINVSEDGMQLRTAYLPEVGQPLTCRFDAGPGQSVMVSGEVTWTESADKGGEFGIRFTDMDADSIDTLRRVCGVNVAIAAAQPGTKVRLHIEGLASPMRARVKDSRSTDVTVGSDLGFLQVGRQLEVEDPQSGSKRPANVDRVEVVVDPESKIPQLVVSLRYGDQPAAAEARPSKSPSRVDAGTSSGVTAAAPAPAPAAASDDLAALDEASNLMKGALARNAAKVGPAIARFAQRARTTVELLAKRRAERERSEDSAPRRTTAPAPGGGLHTDGRRVVRGASAAQIDEAAPEAAPSPMRRRAIAAGAVMAVAIAGALVMKKVHREPVQDPSASASTSPADSAGVAAASPPAADSAGMAAAAAPDAATVAPSLASAPPGDANATPAAAPGQLASTAPVPPADDPSDTAGSKHAKHAHVAPFGNGPVHHGNVLKLKMDSTIEAIEGASQPTGFTVKLPDRKSLEAAAPLAARDSRIAAIKVSNEPAGAELTVNFKDGVPNYQVSARGDTLVIALAPAGALDSVAKKDEHEDKPSHKHRHHAKH